ncbi:MAG: aldehyde dehydrogenase family protein [Nitrospirales bacterium]|nr:aldehyde dehydrogenase family protein [Nitrospirales bacterium]
MRDEEFKIQLFRFVDVLPTLRTHAQFIRIFTEYFGHHPFLPKPLQWAWQRTTTTWLGSHFGALILRRQFFNMAQTFMAGRSISEASFGLGHLWKTGKCASIDLLGEATVNECEADRYQDRCLEALESFHQQASHWPPNPLLDSDHLGLIPRANLSIKLSALYASLDPIAPDDSFEHVAKRLRPILDMAKKLPASITFDMEHAELRELTINLFMRILSEPIYRSFPYAGIALQAYGKDAKGLLTQLLNWLHTHPAPITIRLVKGAYWDSEIIKNLQRGWTIPVLQTKEETDANFENLSQTLLAHTQHIRPAFGSHNLRSLAHAEAYAQATHRPPESYEYQMLYGMAESLQNAVVDYGRRVRIYTPIGDLIPGMAYLVRRLLENTSNESFLRKQHDSSLPLEVLLAQPHTSNGGDGQNLISSRFFHESKDYQFQNEPHTDFSIESARMDMENAIRTVQSHLGQPVEYVVPASRVYSKETLTSRNPSRPQEIIASFPALNPRCLNTFIQAAQSAFPEWRNTPYEYRTSLLRKAAAAMRTRRFELAAWEIFETGKPWREADADVAEAIDFLEFYAHDIQYLGKLKRLGTDPGELNHLTHSPRGLVATISPWNFSLAIPTGMVSAALVTGNVVLFKPSERSLHMGYQLFQIFQEAGIPKDVLHFLPGGPAIGQALVSHPDIHMIAFTGSKDVGLRILAEANNPPSTQSHIKHVIAEMSGKNAIIVDETADLDEAVSGLLKSFTGYQGQKCSACSRAIVHTAIYKELIERLTEAAKDLHIGPPENPANHLGPLIDEHALGKVRHYVEIGNQEGRLLLDGRQEGEGWFQGPVIFTDICPSHRLAQEEIFGPVLAIMKYRDFNEALDIANQSAYALTGGIYSRSPVNIQRARASFDVGNLYINRSITGSLVGRQPFGGHRLSGVGMKAGGEYYLEQFTTQRIICENTLRRGFAPLE